MNKVNRVKKFLQTNNLDSWLIVCNEDSDIHSSYLLGIESHSNHFICVNANTKSQILTTKMESAMTQKAIEKNGYDMETISYSSADELQEKLKELLANKNSIALNYGENLYTPESTGFADYIKAGQKEVLTKFAPHTIFSSAASIIREMRLIKTEEEIKDLREAVISTLEILEQVPEWVKPGVTTEKALQAKIYYEYGKIGGKPAFDAIVGTEGNAADPHHNTSTRKIKKDAVLLIDTGVKLNQMASDITWTYWVGSNPPEEFMNAYKALYESKEVANKYMKEGEKIIEPALKCREFMASKGFDHEKLMIHGFGHSLGFEVHDIGDRMSSKASPEPILKDGMVYTSEPGFYWPGKYGIRLEDDVVIRKDKGEVLSYNHKEPKMI